MKQPNFKLPLKVIHCTVDSEIKDSGKEIEDGIYITYLNGAFQPQDAEYIVEACNNFPEAVELLKEGLDQLQSWKRDDEEDSFTMKRIEEFLKEINNG